MNILEILLTFEPGTVTDTYNNSTWDTKVEDLVFKIRLDNIVRPQREEEGEREGGRLRRRKRKIDDFFLGKNWTLKYCL